ncbi:hypothetical protein HJC99_03480 [Candidatus Saccharibacteria bacterium]|nr:hypothetical protein [Candidatus Saccharibacteria bacterium]
MTASDFWEIAGAVGNVAAIAIGATAAIVGLWIFVASYGGTAAQNASDESTGHNREHAPIDQ